MADKLLEDLTKSLDKAENNNVDMTISEVKKVKKEIKKVKADDNITKGDKARARKKIKALNEQASQVKQPSLAVGTGKNAKANPRPPNINKDGLRCYIRYNNMGVPYRICSDAQGRKPRKPKSQITPQIAPEEFANKHGGYSNLTESQVREYHRLDMRERRAEEQKAREQGEKFVKQFREEKKRQRKKDAKLKLKIGKVKKEAKQAIKKEKQETGFAIPLSLRGKDSLSRTTKTLEQAKDSSSDQMRETALTGIGISMRNDIKGMNKKEFNSFINSSALDDLKKLKVKSSVLETIKDNIALKKQQLKD